MVWVRFLQDYEKHKSGQIIDVGRFNHACALVRGSIALWAEVDDQGTPIGGVTDVGDDGGEITFGITRANSTLDVAPTIAEIRAWQNPFDSNATTYSGARLPAAAGANCFVGLSDETLEQWELIDTSSETWKKVGETVPGGGAAASPAMYFITRDENGLARNTAPTIAEITAWQNPLDSNNTTYSAASLLAGDQCVVTHFDNAYETWYCTDAGSETWVQTSICYDLHMLNTKYLRNDPESNYDIWWEGAGHQFLRAGIREESNIVPNGIGAGGFIHNVNFESFALYNVHEWILFCRQQDVGPYSWEAYDEVGATTIGHYAEFLDSTVPANPPNATPHITAYRSMDNASNQLYYEYTDTNILNWSEVTLSDTGASANLVLRAHQDVGSGVSEAKIEIAAQPLGTDPLNIILRTEKIDAETATSGWVLTLQPSTKSGQLTGHAEWAAAPTGLPGTVIFQDEGSTVVTSGTFNVVGSAGTITDVGGVATLTLTGGGAGGGGGNAFKGALVKKSTTQSATGGANTPVTWDQETYDEGGWHDNVTNNTRLTVPAGVSRIRLTAGVLRTDATSVWNVKFWKNGNASFDGATWQVTDNASFGEGSQISSAVLEVVEGDYFEAVVNTPTTGTIYAGPETFFGIEKVGEYEPVHFIEREVVPYGTAITTGDGKVYATIPAELDGFNLVAVGIAMGATKPVGSTVIVDLARLRAATPGAASRTDVDILSTNLTIDDGEWDSKDAVVPAVIDAANDDVAEGDIIRVDIDQVGSGTAGDGLFVRLGFAL
jgi:hypothetical protein